MENFFDLLNLETPSKALSFLKQFHETTQKIRDKITKNNFYLLIFLLIIFIFYYIIKKFDLKKLIVNKPL